MANTITFDDLTKQITSTSPKHHRRIVAIDGGGGAGKTTFATFLRKVIPDSFVVKIDDFYRPPQLRIPLQSVEVINPNMDWDRLRMLVLEAVRGDRDISYQLYDFKAGTLSGDTIHVPKDASTIIVEGVWSYQEAFIDFYDYLIWLEAPADIRLERGVKRDGEDLRQVWIDEWIPIDEYYQKSYQPKLKANCVIDSIESDFKNDKIVLLQ